MSEKRKKRSEIQENYKWNLSSLYDNIDDWYKNTAKIEPLVNDIITYKNHIMDNSKNLLNTLEKANELHRLVFNLLVYAHMKYHEDTGNNEAIIIKGKIDRIMTEVEEKTFFIEPEILKSEYSIIEQYMNELKSLKQYKFYFERLFRQKDHILNDDEEKLMASLGEVLETPSDVFNTITNTDFKYGTIVINNKKIEIADSNFVKLLMSDDREVRRKAFKKYYKVYNNFKNTLAATLKNNVKAGTFIAKTRKYDSPLQMSLYANKIDLSVYDNLIKVVNKNLDVLHKYIDLRKKELKVDKLHMYDIYASMVDNSTKEYSYEEAIKIVKRALKPLGEDYLKILDKAFEERWIDVYDNEGKKSGAYSWGTYESNPYILLNYNNTLNNVSTIAHELGHSVHSYYTNKKQPYIYSGYAIFNAEVASTVNEILLNKYMYHNTNDVKEKKILLNELLEHFKSTLFRQTMFAEFEKIIFEKEANNEVLTSAEISKIYYTLNKKYYGKDIIHDKEISLEWARIPHFYTPFYVYQYATGISAACAIAMDILNGNEKTLDNYKKFLASGSSDYPINLLKMVGVDMTTTEPIEKAIKLFNDTINQYIALE